MTKQQIEDKIVTVTERLRRLRAMAGKYKEHGMEAAVYRTEMRIAEVSQEQDDLTELLDSVRFDEEIRDA